MLLYLPLVVLVLLFTLIPVAFADTFYNPHLPSNNMTGPIGITDEVKQAHSNLTQMMLDRYAQLPGSTLEYPIIMTYVNNTTGLLEIWMHPLALAQGNVYDPLQVVEDLGFNPSVKLGITYGLVQEDTFGAFDYLCNPSPIHQSYTAFCNAGNPYTFTDIQQPTLAVPTTFSPPQQIVDWDYTPRNVMAFAYNGHLSVVWDKPNVPSTDLS